MRSVVRAAAVTHLAALLLAPGQAAAGARLKGSVRVDGSSTVFPITEAVAEEFRAVQPRVRVTVGFSGTGGGFKKFIAGETDINDASRPIRPEEAARAAERGVEFIELPVAIDGLSVVVHPSNDFVDYLTVEELRRIWRPGSTVRTWRDVRPEWPARTISLYGPGHDSGTFDYFTETINGKAQACRADFQASEDDNVLVQGVAGDPDALAFFGFAYYVENRDRLRAVPIDGGSGPVAPSAAAVRDGTYRPLSRPVFVYVKRSAADRPEVEAFVRFYLEHAAALAAEVGYVPLPPGVYDAVRRRFERRVTGTVFGEGAAGGSLERLLGRGLPRE